MRAVDYISYLVENNKLETQTADQAYEGYINEVEEASSTKAFFRAKFNARKRALGMSLTEIKKADPVVVPVTDEVVEETNDQDNDQDVEEVEYDSNKIEVGPTTEEQLNSTAKVEQLSTYPCTEGFSKEDVETILEADANPSEPTEALKDLAEEYNNVVEAKETPEACKETLESITSKLKPAHTPAPAPVVNEVPAEDVEGPKSNDQGELIEESEEPVFKVVSYNNGEDLPELPGLIPTGTLFDKVICDRVTSEEDKIDVDPRNWERGGFTRKCCDVVAGGAGK